MPPSLADPPPPTLPPRMNAASADRLRTTMAATKVSFTWFGVRKSLSAAQKAQAADSFSAEAKFLSAAKKLLDTQHPAYQAVTAVRGQIVQHWKSLTLPYPEPGLRLIRQDDLAPFDQQLGRFREDLQSAVCALDEQYAELRRSARGRLGELFNAADYPPSLQDEFAVTWEFPSVEPPPYLAQLNPRLYEQECQRVQARFDEAVELAEQAFVDELAQLVSHLTDRLAGSDDGKPKVFRDSAVEHLSEFFQRFRRLNIGSNAQLDELVGQAQQIVRGVQPQQLRDNTSLRQRVVTQLTGVQATLDGLLVDRPRRSILRPSRPGPA
ncbi:MAG TPA: hypothetical protein VM165_15970 [Planctomycetaceae bacterium]|nr:hypothetical protein [Planctomycetaceae bacterium]